MSTITVIKEQLSLVRHDGGYAYFRNWSGSRPTTKSFDTTTGEMGLTIRKMDRQEEKNRKFESMTPAQRRVEIAKDVLAQLKAETLLALKGYYVRPLLSMEVVEGDLAESIPTVCQACALGSLLLSSLREFDGVCVVRGGRPEDAHDMFAEVMPMVLPDFFEIDQLVLIESCFEGWARFPVRKDDELFQYMWMPWATHSARLHAIMENIIANEGEFLPLVWDQP